MAGVKKTSMAITSQALKKSVLKLLPSYMSHRLESSRQARPPFLKPHKAMSIFRIEYPKYSLGAYLYVGAGGRKVDREGGRIQRDEREREIRELTDRRDR